MGLTHLMDRVLLFLLVMRWKSWYLEYIGRGLNFGCGATSSKLRDRDEAIVDLGQLVTRIVLSFDFMYIDLQRLRWEKKNGGRSDTLWT